MIFVARITTSLPNFHFAVKGHPIGFVIEADSQDKALEEFNLLSLSPLSGIYGFTYHDVENISIVPEKTFYMLNDIKVY
jgi:hypothetical protein